MTAKVKIMDPWALVDTDKAQNDSPAQEFEDNFAPTLRDTLPDSEQYLATLEKKLNDLRNDPNVLKQLAEKREACMQYLLNNSVNFDNDDSLDAPVERHNLIRTVLPQQAISRGELVGFIDYDQLDLVDSGRESD